MSKLKIFTKCNICNLDISNNGFYRHAMFCGVTKPPKISLRDIKTTCKFCFKEFAGNSVKNHEVRCVNNANRKTQRPSEAAVIRQREAAAAGKYNWSYEKKLKHSNKMKQVVRDNPDSYSSGNVCGRVKVEEYNGEKFHGKWEVLVAKWLDANEIEWIRKVEPFNYFWNSGWHLYFPDFYLPMLNVYVEVKGYETDRDRCKWSAVKNLIVIKQKEIESIKNNTYSLEQP